jgi:hypothetical protein
LFTCPATIAKIRIRNNIMSRFLPLNYAEGSGLFFDGTTGHVVVALRNQILTRIHPSGRLDAGEIRSSAGVVIAAGGLTAAGNITTSAGNIATTAGDISTAAGNVETTLGVIGGTVTPRKRRILVPIRALSLGAVPPSDGWIGLYDALEFDADAETAHLALRVPDDWDGATAITLSLAWSPEPGTAIADTETVIWLGEWRATPAAGVADAGTTGKTTDTYTQAGAGTDKEVIVSQLDLDPADLDQPIAAGDILSIQISRDMTTDTYAADACLLALWVDYDSSALAVE